MIAKAIHKAHQAGLRGGSTVDAVEAVGHLAVKAAAVHQDPDEQDAVGETVGGDGDAGRVAAVVVSFAAYQPQGFLFLHSND